MGLVLMVKAFGEVTSIGLSPSTPSPTTETNRNTPVAIGALVVWGCGFTYLFTAHRPKRFLYQTVEAYNQSRRPRISWQVVPTGTGVRVAGAF